VVDMNDDVLQECEHLVAWNPRISILAVAKIIGARFVIRGIRLAGSGHEGVICASVVVVGVV